MSSTFDTSLIDNLVQSVVDPLRSALYPAMGNRSHDVYLVKRLWSGARRGQGTATITQNIKMDPPPRVGFENNQQALHYEASPSGRAEEGDCGLTEVSLAYSEADLTGGTLKPNEEFYYRLVDAHGQGMQTRYYVVDAPPRVDREKDIGWAVSLRRVEITE